MASAPPPIISQRRRRARSAAAFAASASQSGVPDPPGPQAGPPCPKLMGRILRKSVWRPAGWPVTIRPHGSC
ncbi:hypothetical protein FNX44_011100 [Streptomyces sp. OF1]|uniref:Uncharacterized protein n=1 Tax=Streptomyces alkaliterrae TaxID=2213162 RepID=A0A5P0YQ75_9ACTN|nr:hypothetical protein [Streptomyces alkaliterrae]